MPVQIDITDRRCFSEFYNGEDFLSNLTEFTENLTGSVIERVKVVNTMRITSYSFSEDFATWDITTTKITRQSGSFIDDGFSDGSTFDYYTAWNTATPVNEFAGVVTFVSGDGLRLEYTGGPPAVPGVDIANVALVATNVASSLIYKFGILENDESANYISKVSQNEQSYYATGIGMAPLDMTPLGNLKDWLTGSATVEFIGTVGLAQEYQVAHEFRINSYYLEGELVNITNSSPTDITTGTNSLKYVFEAELRTVLSNPNTAIASADSDYQGSVGYFGENLNGFINDYNIESISYAETIGGAPLTALKLGVQTAVAIVVSKDSAPFGMGERVGVFVHYLPTQAEYTNTTTDQDYNYMLDSVYTNEGAAPVDGDFITDVIVIEVDSQMYITFNVLNDTNQQLRLTENSKYAIHIHLGDDSIAAGSSDRVMNTADVQNYIKSADIPDLIAVSNFKLFDHCMNIDTDDGATDMEGCNNDGIAIKATIDLDLNKSSVLTDLELVVVAYNTVTQESFDMSSYTFQLPEIISSDIQQLNISDTRGYIDFGIAQFNNVSMVVGANAGGIQSYDIEIGQKIAWQDWIANLAADTVFYDNSEDNDNLNLKSSNYSELNNYLIKVGLRSKCTGVSIIGEEGGANNQFLTDFVTYDYDLDGEITPVWSFVTETFNNDTASDIGGAVLSGTDTLIRVTCTNSLGPVTNLTTYWAQIKLQIFESLGKDIKEAGTLYDIDSSSIFKPLTGFTKTKMTIDSGNVILEVLVDGNKVSESDKFNIFGRIHDGIPTNAKLTSPDNTPKETSGGSPEIKVTSP